ncbi:tRNA lysidine(34) synthetase TilS [Wenzhouxiangella marina]|uniref:tRNA(Ile)-lysidine synthase n=1 Tax=Wenzhouxiangella marina TaxID=1579979 RepID=A0A0K0XWS4_9GAMM|nr:tRNA lysidine(34) synthetase TilS [Wenzhouxiangella marina]AKS42082.1 hypothetical protein WM2015_1712 [Wenzhouxiangella marina]MBB6086149.1 tRNA(Ile)-lysidine synthase [Wenzhouxiangella marina]
MSPRLSDAGPPLHPSPSELPGRGPLLIAFSGGPDSVCLAQELKRSTTPRELICVHVDHALDEHSATRARQAADLAAALDLPCRVERLQLPRQGNVEARAREARYAALQRHMDAETTLLTAHHRDDQIETVLLRLLRGAGPAGLAGIPRLRRLGPGWLARPLLDWSREQILDRLRDLDLNWIEDPSNTLSHFDRNFLRQDILPSLRERWPGLDRAILRSARLAGAAAEELEAFAERDLADCLGEAGCLRLDRLQSLSSYRQAQLLLSWCDRLGLPRPPGRRLDSLIEQLAEARADRQPELRWSGLALRAWRSGLWLDVESWPQDYTLDWPPGEPLQLPPPLGVLRLNGTSRLPGLTVSSGRAGERFRPRPDGPRRLVQQWLAERDIPPWSRTAWPRIRLDDQLVALGTDWLDPGFADRLAAEGLELRWDRLDFAP